MITGFPNVLPPIEFAYTKIPVLSLVFLTQLNTVLAPASDVIKGDDPSSESTMEGVDTVNEGSFGLIKDAHIIAAIDMAKKNLFMAIICVLADGFKSSRLTVDG